VSRHATVHADFIHQGSNSSDKDTASLLTVILEFSVDHDWLQCAQVTALQPFAIHDRCLAVPLRPHLRPLWFFSVAILLEPPVTIQTKWLHISAPPMPFEYSLHAYFRNTTAATTSIVCDIGQHFGLVLLHIPCVTAYCVDTQSTNSTFSRLRLTESIVFVCFSNATKANRHDSDNEEPTAAFVTHQHGLLCSRCLSLSYSWITRCTELLLTFHWQGCCQ
jgi:hypothetical protein